MFRDSGLKIDQQRARNIGRNLFHKYDTSRRGILQPKHCYELFSDYCYRILNISNAPTMEEAPSMHKVLDFDRDQKVTESDFQNLAVKFLCQSNSRMASSYMEDRQQYKSTAGSRIMTSAARNRLDVIQRLFRQFDSDKNGYLTEDQIPGILRETYRELGQKNYYPSPQDVKSYMRMVDTNMDGKVSLAEFEAIVLKSLQKAGIQIYEN